MLGKTVEGLTHMVASSHSEGQSLMQFDDVVVVFGGMVLHPCK